MNIKINDNLYDVIITRKNNKNMYLRVKEDLKIYITAPNYISDKQIVKFIENNFKYIEKSLKEKEQKQELNQNKLLYLGNSYEICYTNKNKVIFGNEKIFIGKNTNLDNFYKKEAKDIFKKHLDYCYDLFEENILYPTLKIRKMKSKWGVCNITKNNVTLNLELIKLAPKYLNYVIIHELCHLIHANHSKKFWDIVSKYEKNYKIIRKEMKNIL